MQRFTKLVVWCRAHQLVLMVYRLTARFPADERYAIVAQLRRAAASVPANIAEGARREGRADYARMLNIAQGSLAETEYFVLLSRDLGYLVPDAADSCFDEITQLARMLHALRSKVLHPA
jgi:four helix bundle protein